MNCATCLQPISSCSCNMNKSDNVNYTGPNLLCTGVNTNDNMTLVIKKLNDVYCGLLPITTTSTSTTLSLTKYFSYVAMIDQFDVADPTAIMERKDFTSTIIY